MYYIFIFFMYISSVCDWWLIDLFIRFLIDDDTWNQKTTMKSVKDGLAVKMTILRYQTNFYGVNGNFPEYLRY